MSLKSRRGLLLNKTIQNKISLVTVNKDIVDSCPYSTHARFQYQYRITIGDTDFWYASNYPFYGIVDTTHDIISFCFTNDVYRNGDLYRPEYPSTYIGDKNGQAYYRESYPRNKEKYSTVRSNYPIYEWED